MHSFRLLCRFKYTPEQVKAMFKAAAQHNVRSGGVYEHTVGEITRWTRAWTTAEDKWNSEPVIIFHFRRGADGGIWGVEYDVKVGEAVAFRVLGELERRALGETIFGAPGKVSA